MERASEELEAGLGRVPTSGELAERLEMSPAELDALVARVRATALLSLEEVLPHRSGDGVPLADTLADDDSDVAFDLERDEQRAELVRAVESLPPQERTVITLYYFKGQRLREIKAALGVSESRVSQIHSVAVAHLRQLLR